MGIFTGEDLSDAPYLPGVYALVSFNPRADKPKDTIIYVGMTNGRKTKSGNGYKYNGIRTRLKQHLVEHTGTAGNQKWPVQIDISQVDKIYYWLTDDLELGLAPTRNAFIFEEFVKCQEEYSPMYRDSKSGNLPEHEMLIVNNPSAAMMDLLENQRNEITLPSRSNLVYRVMELEKKVSEISRILGDILSNK